MWLLCRAAELWVARKKRLEKWRRQPEISGRPWGKGGFLKISTLKTVRFSLVIAGPL
jgi:hypothetical protein